MSFQCYARNTFEVSEVYIRVGTGTVHMKMCLGVSTYTWADTAQMRSDVHTRGGTPHIKMCSDVHTREEQCT